MKRYVFPLAHVRRIRAIQRDLAAAGLADANRAITEREQSLAASRAALAGVAASARTPTGPTELFLSQRQLAALGASAGRADEDALIASVRTAAERRDAWALAARRVEGLDRLDARQRDAHTLEATRDDDRVIDDIVTGRFGRAR
jgi:flagellar export protein FliJ